ncbi:MAG: NADP-dependent oxidoreductase [Gammaproteobacteria bacterium]|nr:NADP-dependent oxidoreductase [Gammaproteobacteria bacterium]
MTQSSEVHLTSRPQGNPVATDFEIVEVNIEDPAEGQVLVKNIYMSVDPYMRGRMRFAKPNELLMGGAVGKVVASNNTNFAEGDYVSNGSGWREYFLSDGADLSKVDPSLAPLSAYLGVMGMPGLTAYGGLLVTGEMKDGEAVFVSAASGAVGSVVGQIAKIKGGIAIGSAGSDDKVTQLAEEFGFDHAFNYKTADPLEELRRGAPNGIDIYFENVGGAQLEAALTHIKPYGRIPICGMIAHYNDGDTLTPGPRNLMETIYKFVHLKGFVVSAFEDQREQFVQDMSGWLSSGQMKYHETIHEGIENAPAAFMGLFTGSNNGKMLVRLAED